MKYCPDCGAECGHEDSKCQECRFPLVLQTVDEGHRFILPSSDRKGWLKVFTLLRKNGLVINQETVHGMTERQAWLIFPGFGLLILVVSLLFSRPLANWLIPAPEAPVQIVFNQDQQATQQEEGLSEDISVLKEALGSDEGGHVIDQTSQEPEVMPIIPMERIQEMARLCSLQIIVGEKTGFGTYFLSQGYAFSTTSLMDRAFTRETGTIQGDKSLVQGTLKIVPEVSFQGQPLTPLSLIHRLDAPPITIFQLEQSLGLEMKLNFKEYPQIDDLVWVTSWLDGQFQVSQTRVGQIVTVDETPQFMLEIDNYSKNEGLPVFNEAGELTGIQTAVSGQNGFIPLVSLREKVPLVYRDIYSVLNGTATRL